MLLHVCLPFLLLTPVLTKERENPTVHILPTYSLHASDSLPLPIRISRRTHGSKTQAHSCPRNTPPESQSTSPKPGRVPKNRAHAHSYPNSETTIAIRRACRAASHDFQHPRPQHYVLAQRPTLCRRHTEHLPFPSPPGPVPSCARKLVGKASPAQGVSMRSRHLRATRSGAQDVVLACR